MTWTFTLKNGDSFSSNNLKYPDSLLVGYNQTTVRTEVSKYTTRAGGLEVGNRREAVGSLDISYTSADKNALAVSDINKLYKWCKYLDYITNEDGLIMYVTPKSPKTSSPLGSRSKVIEFSCSFSTIKPYWQGAEITQTEALSGSAVNRFDIEADGTAEILPVFKILIPNGQTLNTLLITNTYNSESFQILSAGLLGDGVKTLDIDSDAGTVTFGEVDVVPKVVPGSGFVEISPFTNSFEVTVNINCSLDIVYREGVYLG